MFYESWKNWALMLVVLVGATFEVIKHMPNHEAAWEADALPFAADVKPYSVNEVSHHRVRRVNPAPAATAARGARVAGVQQVLQNELNKYLATNTPTATEFDKTKTDGKTELKKSKKKKDDDEYEEVIDPVTGKKVRRKKKKDAKVDDKKDAVVVTAPPVPKPADDIPTAIDDAIAAGGVGATPFAPTAATPPSPDAFGSLEDWIKRLLTYPDLKATQAFIQQYQENLVTADIFYKIATMMVEDSRPEMKQLGVLCAGTNTNLVSFELLAQVYKNERSGSALQNQVVAFLARYSSLGNLPILKNILTGADTYSQTLAAARLDLLAEQTRTTQTTATTSPTATAQSIATLRTSNVTHFQAFVTILKGLSASTDAGLKTQAQRTLADLESLVGLAITSPTTAATTTTTASTQVP